VTPLANLQLSAYDRISGTHRVVLLLAGVSAGALLTQEARGVGWRLGICALLAAAALGGYVYWDWTRNGLSGAVWALLVKVGIGVLVVLLGWWIAQAGPRGIRHDQAAGRKAGREAGRKAGREAGAIAGREAGGAAGAKAYERAGEQVGGEAGETAGREVGEKAGMEAGEQAGRKAGERAGQNARRTNQLLSYLPGQGQRANSAALKAAAQAAGEKAGEQAGREAGESAGRQAGHQAGELAGRQAGKDADDEAAQGATRSAPP
jgi:hypothetical protein